MPVAVPLLAAGAYAAVKSSGGKVFSDGKYNSQGPAHYGDGWVDSRGAKDAADKWNAMTPEQQAAMRDQMSAMPGGFQDPNQVLATLNSQKPASQLNAERMEGLANQDRAMGSQLAGEFKQASNVDQNGFNRNMEGAEGNLSSAENFVNNDLAARARGGYGGSASQMAATAQAEDARRALASAQASRGGAFHGAGATANATVAAQRQANQTGILGYNQEKIANQQAYLQGLQGNSAARAGLGNAQGQFQLGVTGQRLAGMSGAAGSYFAGSKSAQGYENLGQQPALAEMEARESANKRADAAALNAANAPTAIERGIGIATEVGKIGAAAGSDKRIKWGAKRQAAKAEASRAPKLTAMLKGLK